MKNTKREITDFQTLVDIIHRCDTIRLGINSEEYPYVVPVSFGFETLDGKLIIYFHGAREGFKHELLERDNRVCVEADICHGFVKHQSSVTTEYESVIGFGRAVIVRDNEAVHGLDLLLEHCGFGGFPFDTAVLAATKVYKIVLDSVTGKHFTI